MGEGQYLDRGVIRIHEWEQRTELLAHDFRATDGSPNGSLVQNDAQLWSVGGLKALLPTQPRGDQLVDRGGFSVRVERRQERLCVGRCLEQTRDRGSRVLFDGARFGLKSHVSAVLAGVNVEPDEAEHPREHHAGTQGNVELGSQSFVQMLPVLELRHLRFVEPEDSRQRGNAETGSLALHPDFRAVAMTWGQLRVESALLERHVQPPVLREPARNRAGCRIGALCAIPSIHKVVARIRP